MVVLVMRAVRISGVVCLSWALSTSGAVAERQQPHATNVPPPVIVRVSAERFAFTPSEITVQQGSVIEFHLTSDDTDHGFRILGTDIDVPIPKRRRGETVVTYTADTAGRFIIECSRPCGAGHTAMRATLVVK